MSNAVLTRARSAVKAVGMKPSGILALPERQAVRLCPGLGPKGLQALREAEQSAPPTVVVTRHAALVEYLSERGLVSGDLRVIAHATAQDVQGQHVVGVLPLHLAAEAASVTEVTLDLRPDQRGRELTVEELRAAARGVQRYVVRRVP